LHRLSAIILNTVNVSYSDPLLTFGNNLIKEMTTFTSLGLDQEILSALEDLGFQTPTPIQEKAIPILLEGERDLVALAQTGTGKTAAFGLPLIQKMHFKGHTEALVLAPTRELCMQIARDLVQYAKHKPKVNVVPVYGGAGIREQIAQIRAGAGIVVATPGRLIDLMERKAIDLSKLRMVVLDEADEMLNMGFKEDIDFILEQSPATRQTCLFSATMPNEVRRISKNYMNEPHEVSLAGNTSNENIEHHYYLVKEKNKYESVKRILDALPDVYGILFAQTRKLCQELAEKLIHDGYNADSLHGELSQAQRDKVMGRFRNKSLKVLVATDVAARGIDVSNISHVINYSLPNELEVYTHRSGRTARAGMKGISISLVGNRDLDKIRRLEKITKAQFALQQVPSGQDVIKSKFSHFLEELKLETPDEKAIEPYLDLFHTELKSFTKEQLIQKITSIELKKFIDYYDGASEMNEIAGKGGRERGGRDSGTGQFQKFFLSVGELDGLDKKSMLKWFNDCGLGDVEFGKLAIQKTHSFLEADVASTAKVLAAINDQKFQGRKVRIEVQGFEPDGYTKRKKSGHGEKPRGESKPWERSGEKKSYGGSNGGGGYRGSNDNRGGGEYRSSSENRGGGEKRSGENRGDSGAKAHKPAEKSFTKKKESKGKRW